MEDNDDLKNSVKAFYKANSIDIEDKEIEINPEKNSIIDVSYKEKSFQVKNVPGEFKKEFALMEKGKKEASLIGCSGFEEFKEKYIKEKLRKPVSGNGVILLLWANSPFIVPYNREAIIEIIKSDKEILDLSQKTGYEEIYLLDSNKKIKIYSKN